MNQIKPTVRKQRHIKSSSGNGGAMVVLLGGAAAAGYFLLNKKTVPITANNLTGIIKDSVDASALQGVKVVLSNLSAVSNETGKYVFPDIKTLIGVQTPIAYTKENYIEVDDMITLHTGDNVLNESMVRTRTVTGSVSDSGTGAPIASVSVTVSYTIYNGSKVQLAQTTTDGSGNFSFAGVTFDSEPYIFDFVKTGYQNLEVSVTLQPGPNTISEVMISNMAIFRGYVTDSNSTALSGVLITLVYPPGNPYTVTTAADGSFSISVPPGNYNVTFVKSGYQTVTL